MTTRNISTIRSTLGAPPAFMRAAPFAAVLALSGLFWTTQAHAQAKGDVVVNLGWFHLAPQDSSDPLKINALGRSVESPGSGAEVTNSNTFGLTLNYFFTDNFSVEGVFGYPPKMKLDGTGTLGALGRLGSANEWSPAVLLKYHFNKADAKFRPYVGAGVSYVWYSNVKLEPGLKSGAFLASPTTGNLLTGPTSASLSSSFAPVINAGMTYNIDKHWSVDASVSYLVLSTHATLTTQSAVGTVRSETKLRINPIVSFVSVGYRF